MKKNLNIKTIIKNDVDSDKKDKYGEEEHQFAKYFTKDTINTNTPEQLKEEEKLWINSFAGIGLTKDEGDKKRKDILKKAVLAFFLLILYQLLKLNLLKI